MMAVVPAWKLRELLEQEDVVKTREEEVEEWAADHRKRSKGVFLEAAQDEDITRGDLKQR